MSDDKARRAQLRAEIRRYCMSVPVDKYQSWSAQTGAAYKREAKKAQQLIAKAAATEAQLSAQLNSIKVYWQ